MTANKTTPNSLAMDNASTNTPLLTSLREAWTKRCADYLLLAKPEAVEERNGINPEDIEKINYEFTDLLIQAANNQIKILYLEAQLTADYFMATIKSAREFQNIDDDSNTTFIRPRIRITDHHTIDIAWHKIVPGKYPLADSAIKNRKVFYKTVNGHRVAFAATSVRISKGTLDQYRRSSFNGEPEWVLELIEACEEKFKLIRVKSEKISKMRKAAYEFNAATVKLYDIFAPDSVTRSKPKLPAEYRHLTEDTQNEQEE